MSPFADAVARAALRESLAKLAPNASRQWGRMPPHQMVCHLSDTFRMVTGEAKVKPIDNLVSRTLIRYVALHTPMRWPQGAKTMVEADQEQLGTKPVAWDRDLNQLLTLFDGFQPRDRLAHPLFGPLRLDEWNVWAYRHIHHHLRQFSA